MYFLSFYKIFLKPKILNANAVRTICKKERWKNTFFQFSFLQIACAVNSAGFGQQRKNTQTQEMYFIEYRDRLWYNIISMN